MRRTCLLAYTVWQVPLKNLLRNIDEDGKYITTAFLLNLPLLIKSKKINEFIDKFNEHIRQILKQKYRDRQINVNFDNYAALPKKKSNSSIIRYVKNDPEKIWKVILKPYQDSEVLMTDEEEIIPRKINKRS